METSTNAVEVFRTWAQFGRLLSPLEIKASFTQLKNFIESATRIIEWDYETLKVLLELSSNKLKPFCDPLKVDLGVHKWLKGEKEPLYSDWLAWVIQQIRDPREIFKLFSITDHCDDFASLYPDVIREKQVEKGHKDQGGRVDLLVQYKGFVLIAIEVKLFDADSSDHQKNAGYYESIEKKYKSTIPIRKFVFLVTGADFPEYHNFKVVTWSDLCLRLRNYVLQNKDCEHIVKAMILAFVGAVEHNLLKFSLSYASDLEDTINHINQFVGGNENDHKAKRTGQDSNGINQ